MTNEISVQIERNGYTYTARVTSESDISISRDGIWAGNGKWTNCISDCAADLGEDVYEALEDAITEAMDNYVIATDADTMTVVAMSPDHAAVVYARINRIADIESADDLSNHYTARDGWANITLIITPRATAGPTLEA